MGEIGVALVGCGKIGQKHLQALVHQKALQLVATVDPDIERAEASAVAFDAEAFSTTEEMLDKLSVDAVIVATPSGLHRLQTEKALRYGLHVLVEKPMALSYRDGLAMVRQADKANRILAVTQFNRMLPSVARAIEAVQQGRLGKVIEGSLSVRWARPQSYYDAETWRGTRQMDGGVLFNQAIHALDILLQMMGPVEEVFAHAATLTHDIESEDTVVGTLRFRSGALASVNATTSVPNTNFDERITVIGETGLIGVGPTVNQIEVWRLDDDDEESVQQAIAEMPSRTSWQSHLDALNDFARAILENEQPLLAGASALSAVAVVEALMRSAAENRPVLLSEVTGA